MVDAVLDLVECLRDGGHRPAGVCDAAPEWPDLPVEEVGEAALLGLEVAGEALAAQLGQLRLAGAAAAQ